MTTEALFSFVSILLLLNVVSSPTSALVQAENFGLNVDLIHIDSPGSPFYNGSETPSRLWGNALQRSISRVNCLHQNLWRSAAQSSVVPGRGDYLMKLSIGTPPIEMIAVADTGSDLSWTQCEPCPRCFKQDTPIFDPRNSSTYRNLTCHSSQCQNLKEQSFCLSSTCHYTYSYGDLSTTEGVLAMDTVSLGSYTDQPCTLPHTTFGCGTDNEGNFDGAGIVGLGRGPLSLISRMVHLTNGKFSYCLVPPSSNHSSKMTFGATRVVSGPEMASTPLKSGAVNTFYYLTLEAVSVGGKRFELNNSTNNNNSTSGSTKGNIIIDSGTTLTFLPDDLHSSLYSEVTNAIPLQPVDEDLPEGFTLCYEDKGDFNPPNITMHFQGADVELNAVNTFLPINGNILCFALFPGGDSLSIYGNTQQINFLIEYDLRGNTVSFRPVDCTKY